MRQMLGQRVDAGQLFVGVARSQLARSPLRRTAQAVDGSMDGSVDCGSTLEPPNSPAAPGVSARSRPRLPAPHVRHQERVRVVGVVALLKGCGGVHTRRDPIPERQREDQSWKCDADLRKQLEAGDVLRADEAEMASVQRADAGCAQSLGNGDEAAIDAAEVLIGVLDGERCDSSPIGCR